MRVGEEYYFLFILVGNFPFFQHRMFTWINQVPLFLFDGVVGHMNICNFMQKNACRRRHWFFAVGFFSVKINQTMSTL
jgi:hypothetical protein